MTQAEKLDRVLENKKVCRISKSDFFSNPDSIDVLRCENLKDVHNTKFHHEFEAGYNSCKNLDKRRSDSMVDKFKRILRVDSDEDTEALHNKYKETAKDREEKLKMFEKQLNIKIDSTGKRGNLLLNSYMTTSILFLSILVLLLLSVFLIFKLTARVESMESVLVDIQEYIEKLTVNNTDKHLIIDRMDPGVIKGRKKERTKGK